MNALYSIAGTSKQGFHQWLGRSMAVYEEQAQLLPVLEQLRKDHPKLSCRQMYGMLSPRNMGRDRFESFCHENGLKVAVHKRLYKTTDSRGGFRFPNLLLALNELSGANQLWVSDITYFKIGEQFYFLTFIIDIFNREIIGYNASKSLLTKETTLKALKMAISKTGLTKEQQAILHSDGGGQYYSKEFLELTSSYGIRNSMGKTAYENPHAERVNGTIKNDYLIEYEPGGYNELVTLLKKAVIMYNQFRPHQSLGGYTPQEFGDLARKGILTKVWVVNKKKKVTKKEKVNISIK